MAKKNTVRNEHPPPPMAARRSKHRLASNNQWKSLTSEVEISIACCNIHSDAHTKSAQHWMVWIKIAVYLPAMPHQGFACYIIRAGDNGVVDFLILRLRRISLSASIKATTHLSWT